MSFLGSLLGTVSHLARPENPERVGVGIVLLGGLGAACTLLVGGFLTVSGTLLGLLHLFATLLPLVGVVLVAVTGGWRLRKRVNRETEPSPLVEGVPPERGSVRTLRHVDGEDHIEQAATARYQCRRDEAAVAVRERLVDGAIRTLVASGGLGRDAAENAIRTGEWTDDRVAAAFLATDVSRPLADRLRDAVDPGAAYTRRVERTLSAIEAISAETSADGAGTATTVETNADRPNGNGQGGAR